MTQRMMIMKMISNFMQLFSLVVLVSSSIVPPPSISSSLSSNTTTTTTTATIVDETIQTNYHWQQLIQISNRTYSQLFLPTYINIEQDIIENPAYVSGQCREQMYQTLAGLYRRETWSTKLFNSWAKFPPTGSLLGTLTDFGDYDQCRSLTNTLYCLVDIALPMPMPMPEHHNYFHRAIVFGSGVDGNSDDNATTSWTYNVNDDDNANVIPLSAPLFTPLPPPSPSSLFHYLADVNAVFYYAYIQLGICLPSGCTNFDIENVANQKLNPYGLSVHKITCEPSKWTTTKTTTTSSAPKHQYSPSSSSSSSSFFTATTTTLGSLNAFQFIALLCLLIVGTLNLLALLYERCVLPHVKQNRKHNKNNVTKQQQKQQDVIHQSQQQQRQKQYCWSSPSSPYICVLRCFSPTLNTYKLIHTKSIEEELGCIHGLRFFTICWIIIGHTLDWNNVNMYRDTFTLREKLTEFGKQPLFKGFNSVETFFYLSGMLTSYALLQFTKGEWHRFHLVPYIVLRYIRLTPQLIIYLLLNTLLPPMFDGPIWNRYVSKFDVCYTNWWHNLIYLQNILSIDNICALHTWFLAADMQLHWLSLIPVILLLRNEKIGILSTKTLILLFGTISSTAIYLKRFPPGTVITWKNDFLNEDGMPSPFHAFLYQSYTHTTSFFIGFLFGIFVMKKFITTNKPQYWVMRPVIRYAHWCAVFATYLFVCYSTIPWLYGRPYDPLWSSILFPLNQTLWATMLSHCIWLCITGNGGAVGALLTWAPFKPLSRMTYSVYLTHTWVLCVALGTRRSLIDLHTYSASLLCAATITCSFVVAFVFTVMFEAPLFHLLEHIKRKSYQVINDDCGTISVEDEDDEEAENEEEEEEEVEEEEKKQMVQLNQLNNNHSVSSTMV